MLDPETFAYLQAGDGDAAATWESLRLRPRVLRGVEKVEIATTLFGRALPLPILTAPNGRATRYCAEGELALLEAAERACSIAVLPSSVASSAAALHRLRPAARWWQQLYMAADRNRLRDLLQSLPAGGCEAVVLTVDLLADGRSPPAPPLAAWEAPQVRAALPLAFAAATLDDLAWLCAEAGLPVIVKGVLRGDDAALCAKAGAAGLIVSNHGGNQLATAISSAEALAEVVDAAGRAEVLVDGGIRSGVSVLKALALGARAVLVGRPASHALAAGGAEAVAAMLGGLGAELSRVMALCGAGALGDLDPSLVAGGSVCSPIR